ncbi:MAG TPA: pentapeptide repeat-containing protein, partial [Ktedonobacterales bacterium]|nr:pentapeptide repeat-containing protein [Ktedonobacterales bacterium]
MMDLIDQFIQRVRLNDIDFSGTDLAKADLTDADLSGANLSGANLSGATITRADLRGANLSDAHLEDIKGTPFWWPEVDLATIDRLCQEVLDPTTAPQRVQEVMTSWPGYLLRDRLAYHPAAPEAIRTPEPNDPKPKESLQQRLETEYQANLEAGNPPYEAVEIETYAELLWIFDQRRWSGEPTLPDGMKRPDLRNAIINDANLSRSQLSQANLSGAKIDEASFGGTMLAGATLTAASLTYADLRQADLQGADLSHADMHEANLRGAHLNEANLSHANLRGANLDRADLRGCLLADANLEAIEGTPLWPSVAEAELDHLRRLACDPSTDPQQLEVIAVSWPGYLIRDVIAGNPAIPANRLAGFALEFPLALLQNPVIPLLFLEDPLWLDATYAYYCLRELERLPNFPQIVEQHRQILGLIAFCAQPRIKQEIKQDHSRLYQLGKAAHDRHQDDDAIRFYDLSFRFDPADAATWNSKGIALNTLKRHEEAVAAYDQTLALDPSYKYAWSNKGIALYDQKHYEEAIIAYEQRLALDPADADTLYNKGLALRYLQRYEEAVAAYEQAIARKPADVDTWNAKGNALRLLTRYGEALDAFEQALTLNPSYAWAWYNKGLTLRNMKRYEEALAAYE